MANEKRRGPGGGGPRMNMGGEKPRNTKAALAFVWNYVKKRKGALIVALVMTLVNVLVSLYATSLLQPIIDNFLNSETAGALTTAQRSAGLIRGVLQIGILYVLEVITMYIQSRVLVGFSQRSMNDVREDLFTHMQSLPIRYFDGTTRGELMSRMTNDCDALNEALSNSIVTLFSCTLSLVGVIYMMFSRSVPLTLINLCVVPLLLLTVGGLMKKARKYFAERQEKLGALNGYVEEMVTGQKVVKVFEHERQATEHFDELNEQLRRSNETAMTFGGMIMPISRNMNNIMYALIATIGGLLALGGAGLSMGALIVFLNLSSRFGRPLNEIANQFNSIITALSGAERIRDVMEQPSENYGGEYALVQEDGKFYWKSAENKVEALGDVRFSNVDFAYEENKQVLYDLTLYAKPSQKIAFVGSTGAGKTTIINLLTRFYEVTDGEILIDGIDSKKIDLQSVRAAMAVVLQDTHLFTGTVRENIRYGRLDATDEEVEQAARMTHAHSFIRRLPQGYDTVIEGDGTNLSQGQRQLLNIARAAIADSPILVLDEATSSVDTRTERQIEKGLDSMMADRTTYVIAHRLSTVRNSNAIMVMENGRIIERGTHEDLLALHGRYYELYTGKAELA